MNFKNRQHLALLFIIAGLILSPANRCIAQNMDAPPILGAWDPMLKYSINFSQQSSDSLIGQQDGDNISIGTIISGELNLKETAFELRQNLDLNEATSKSQTVPRYLKSSDELKYQLVYLYNLNSYPKLSPYFKFSLKTSLFRGENFQTGRIIKLTDSFRPFKTKESLGVLGKAIESEQQKLEIRLGFAAEQMKADSQLAVDSYDAETNQLLLTTLEDYDQLGVEIGAEYNYKFDKQSSAKLTLELLQPLSPNLKKGDKRSGTELLDSQIVANLNTKSYSWLSFSLEAKYLRQPLLQVQEQKQILLLANITQVLIE